jgi:hypothetical protein
MNFLHDSKLGYTDGISTVNNKKEWILLDEFFSTLFDNTENLKLETERTLRFSNKLHTIDSSQAVNQNSMHEEPQQDIMNTLNEHVQTLSDILLNLKAANENFKLVMGE